MPDNRATFLNGHLQIAQGHLKHGVAVCALESHALPSYARKGQQVLHQLLHTQGAVDRVVNVLIRIRIELALITFRQQLSIGSYHPQGFLQIVRSHVGKLLQLLIGPSQFLLRTLVILAQLFFPHGSPR